MDWQKPWYIWVRIVGGPVEIRTEHFLQVRSLTARTEFQVRVSIVPSHITGSGRARNHNPLNMNHAIIPAVYWYRKYKLRCVSVRWQPVAWNELPRLQALCNQDSRFWMVQLARRLGWGVSQVCSKNIQSLTHAVERIPVWFSTSFLSISSGKWSDSA